MKTIIKWNHCCLIITYKKHRTFWRCNYRLGCKLSSALDSAPFNNSAARFCSDTCTKTVSLGTMTGVWLECSLWHILYILPKMTLYYKLGFEFYTEGLCGYVFLSTVLSTFSTHLRWSHFFVHNWYLYLTSAFHCGLWLWKTFYSSIVDVNKVCF
jgi:hypothetical protein